MILPMRSIRRVLIVQPYGIGDLLFVTPVARALRLLGSVEKVDFLLGSRTEEVLRHNPHVDEIFVLDKDLFHKRTGLENVRELWTLGSKLRANRYDLLIDYSLRGEYAFFSRFLLGIARRLGFDYKRRGFFHTHKLSIPGGFQGRHVADYCCDLVEQIGIPVEDRFLEYYIAPESYAQAGEAIRRQAGRNFQRYLVASPGGGESWGKDAHFKRWPVRYFAELINRLAEDLQMEAVLILGSRGEGPFTAELREHIAKPCLDFAGAVSLSAAAALIDRAALFVGNDGGLVHLAHARKVPLIAFYGPVDPVVYGPYPARRQAAAVVKGGLACRPCYRRFRYESSCPHRDCLQALTPGEVLQNLRDRDFFSGILSRPAAGLKR